MGVATVVDVGHLLMSAWVWFLLVLIALALAEYFRRGDGW